MAEAGALDRGRENVTEIVSSFVTGTWILALIAGFDWWLWFMLFGYMVLVPTVERLFGERWESDGREAGEEWASDGREADEEWQAASEGWRGRPDAWWGDARASDETGTNATPDPNNRDALETLRDRYARGELTDEQFERKVERLLEIETLEDVEDRARESASAGDAGADAETEDGSREPNR